MIHRSPLNHRLEEIVPHQSNSSVKATMASPLSAAASLRSCRVVVTGIGAITPLGNTFAESWQSLLRKETGVTSLTEALSWQGLSSEELLHRELTVAATLPCQVASPVRWQHKDSRTNRFVQLALVAGREAMLESGLDKWIQAGEGQIDRSTTDNPRRHRIGACIGSGMSGVREIAQAVNSMETSGFRKLSPHFVPKVLSNSAAGRLSIEFGLQGPNHSASTACAAGSHAIGDAFRCIQYGNADVMLAGGAESCIDPLSMAGFCRLRALSTAYNDTPEKASRPFDRNRDGFVMGEGAAILVLERLEHALARCAPILAELSGYGLTGDAYHVTAPDPLGRGAQRAIQMALDQSFGDRRYVEEMPVGYVNAHATSTPKGDEIEARVIHDVFRDASPNLIVSGTKGATGHLLGAAGAIEAAFTVQALNTRQIPPTLNLHKTDAETEHFGFQHARDTMHVPTLQVALSNSFGFGGTNASLLFKRISFE